MRPDGADLRLLGELGLLAAGRGMAREAEAIAAGFAAWRPGSALAGIVRALAAMGAGRDGEAARILREDALRAEPDSADARALLGLALERAGYRQAAEAVLDPLAASGAAADETAGRLARAVLEARRGPMGGGQSR